MRQVGTQVECAACDAITVEQYERVERARRAADRITDALRVGGAGGPRDAEGLGLRLFSAVEDLAGLVGVERREYPGEYPTPGVDDEG